MVRAKDSSSRLNTTLVSSGNQSQTEQRGRILGTALRDVFRDRIRIILTESDDEGAGQLCVACGNNTVSVLIEKHNASIARFIECPLEYHDWIFNTDETSHSK